MVCRFFKLSLLRYEYYFFFVEKLQPNSISECYIKTNEELLNKLRSSAANVKPDVN